LKKAEAGHLMAGQSKVFEGSEGSRAPDGGPTARSRGVRPLAGVWGQSPQGL